MKYTFIHVPKVAGQSMLSIIREHQNIVVYPGYSANLGHIRAIWNPYPNTFAFVRNPYDRIVSAYFYFVKNKDLPKHLLIAGKIINRYKTFDNFVMAIERDSLLMDDIPHIKPMYHWTGNQQKIMVDNVFKIEDEGKINTFLCSIGINKRLSDCKVNVSKHDHFMGYITPEIIAEISRLYRRDFELFNYKML